MSFLPSSPHLSPPPASGKRRDGPRWIVEDLIGDADPRLAAVPDPIPLAAIYEGSGI
jgi:hypothetical protein